MIATAPQREQRPLAAAGITAGYIRLTREESILTGLSIPAQRDGIDSYARQRGLPNLTMYLEERAIGADVPFEKRPAGRRLIADVKAGKVSHIICRDVDRLSRDTILWLGFVGICCEHRVTIHTFSGPLALKSPSDRFASTVRAAAAQLEKDQVADRVKRAKRELAKQGKHLGGPPPYGYTSRSRYQAELTAGGTPVDQVKARAEADLARGLVIDEREAQVVRMVFDLYASSLWGCRRIANELNRLGHRRRSGRPWHPDKVRRIINDPAVAGMVPYDELFFEAGVGKRTPKSRQVLHPGKHEPIISLDLWQEAQRLKDRNRPTIEVPLVSRKAPLVGVLRCPCGAPMATRGAGKGKSYFYYICTKRKYYGSTGVGGCQADRVNSDRLHTVFWATLSEIVCSDDAIDRVHDATRRLVGRRRRADESADTSNAELAKIERDIELWYTRHDGAGSEAEKEAAWRRIVQLTEKQQSLRQRAQQHDDAVRPSKAMSRDQVKAYLQGIASLAGNTTDRGRALVLSMVEHQGLKVRMVDERTVSIGISLLSPDPTAEPVELRATVVIPTGSRIDAWVQEQSALAPVCACGCGRHLEVQRRHYWRGVPSYHYACRSSGMRSKRASLTADGYINGTELAKRLGIGRTTLNRWIAAGRLPRPDKGISGMLLFPPQTKPGA